MTTPMVECNICRGQFVKTTDPLHKKELSVFVITDPEYGYGSFPKLVCKTCQSSDLDIPKLLGNLWYDLRSDYRPETDDYFIFNSKKKSIYWCWTNLKANCHICDLPLGNARRIQEEFIFDDANKMHHVGTHTICERCALHIWESNDDFKGFRNKLYCCSRDHVIEKNKHLIETAKRQIAKRKHIQMG